MGRKSLQAQIKAQLISCVRYGESRHAAKDALRTERGESYRFGDSPATVHSYGTFNKYWQVGREFAVYCKEQGVSIYAPLEKTKALAVQYLHERATAIVEINAAGEAAGERYKYSMATVKTERSAFTKIYGERLEVNFERQRRIADITRSRGAKARDRHFSEYRNRNLVTICKATGGRREDITAMSSKDFTYDRSGHLWVKIERSKGGKSRMAPVLQEYKQEVERIIADRRNHERLFDRVHNAADIHGYRREYAQELYHDVVESREYRAELYQAGHWQERNEPHIKGTMYHGKGENAFHGLRDDIAPVSAALGHNRLCVVCQHYLK